MTDDAFHLTPHDVRAQEFQRAMRGYDPAQVENFKERVAEELDRLLRERSRLDERVRSLVEQLRSHRDREQALNEALVAAQKLRVDIQAQASREADVIVNEARLEAGRIVNQAGEEERVVEQRVEAAARLLQTYVGTFRAILDRHVAELNALERYLEVHPSTAPPSEEADRVSAGS